MVTEYANLPISIRLLALHMLFSNRHLSPIIEQLDNDRSVMFQKFVWEKTIEFGIKAKGKDFSRNDITSRMISSEEYQQEQNCSEPLYTCKASSCIHSHPNCARRKIKGQVDVMAEVIWEYIRVCKKREKALQKTSMGQD